MLISKIVVMTPGSLVPQVLNFITNWEPSIEKKISSVSSCVFVKLSEKGFESE